MIERPAQRLEQLKNDLAGESDRGCALILASFLESGLEFAIQKRLVQNKTIYESLFSQSKPMGTFSAKIDLSYMLGLCSKTCHRELHLIRKIRNEFAHTSVGINFENHEIANRCRELRFQIYPDISPRNMYIHSGFAILGFFDNLNASQVSLSYPDSDHLDLFPAIRDKLSLSKQLTNTEGLSE